MTSPDPEVLAAAIKLAEEGLKIFRPHIADPDIKREVEFSEAFVAAAKAYQPMREALEACAASWDSGPTTVSHGYALLSAEFQRRLNIAGEALAALNPAGPA